MVQHCGLVPIELDDEIARGRGNVAIEGIQQRECGAIGSDEDRVRPASLFDGVASVTQVKDVGVGSGAAAQHQVTRVEGQLGWIVGAAGAYDIRAPRRSISDPQMLPYSVAGREEKAISGQRKLLRI